MKHRREYNECSKLDANSIEVKLIAVDDQSSRTHLRSHEVIEILAKMIRLASQRGPVKRSEVEVLDEAA